MNLHLRSGVSILYKKQFMYPASNSPEITQDLFNEEEIVMYEEASTGQRFLNFIIDALIVQYVLATLVGVVLGLFLLSVSPDIFITLDEESLEVTLIGYAISLIMYILYYFITEKAFKGKTLGKLITGTKAVNIDGGALSTKTAMLRSLSRLVPFEPLSALSGSPWHDTWTNTKVVKTR